MTAPLHRVVSPPRTETLPGGRPTVDKWVEEDIRDEQMATSMNRRLMGHTKPDLVDTIVAEEFGLPLPIYCEISRVSFPDWVDPVSKKRQQCTRWYLKARCIVDYPQNEQDLEVKLRTFDQPGLKDIIYTWVMPAETAAQLRDRLRERMVRNDLGAQRPPEGGKGKASSRNNTKPGKQNRAQQR